MSRLHGISPEHVSLSRHRNTAQRDVFRWYPRATLSRSTKRKGKSGFGGGLLVGTFFVLGWVLIDRKTARERRVPGYPRASVPIFVIQLFC